MELTDKEKRDVYYIYRAMHDGICPSCGEEVSKQERLFKYDEEYGNDYDLWCCGCGFQIVWEEIQAIKDIGPEAVKSRLETLKRVREKLC